MTGDGKSIAITPDEIERRRTERSEQLAVRDVPFLRLTGSAFLSLGVFLNNRYILGETSLEPWVMATAALALYAALTWLALRFFYRRLLPFDLGLAFLVGDVFVWTYAIYMSGAERSWLFFIVLMRVADQTQTNFRRCFGFVVVTSLSYAAMLAWVVGVDGRPVAPSIVFTRLLFIVVSGVYIALTSRTAEKRREQMTAAIRMSRDLIRQLEEQSDDLREARARAEEASAAKSEFLANMSHEMRTPLHAVIGMLQLAADGERSQQRLRHLELARHSAESLLATIDDLLDFAKIEARKLVLEPSTISMREFMAETLAPLGVTAAERGLVLSYVVEKSVPSIVRVDPNRLRQVVVNLVANSIKFTPRGEVTIRVRAPIIPIALHFVITDTGVGIDPAKTSMIFEPFTQIEQAEGRRHGGTGLGLAIVARIVEAMGGTIEVASEPGHGSAFSFTIVTEIPEETFPPVDRSALAGRRLLVVEPYELSRTCLSDVLRMNGAAVTACASFEEAPAAQYDCVISAVTAAPRDRYEPLVLLASPRDNVREDMPRVTRPVGERELLEAIDVALGVRPAPVLLPPEVRRAAAPLRVLLAEDHPVSQEFAAEALRRLGHEVVAVSDGEEALAALQGELFDAVLMDVQMPKLDGVEVTQRFRAMERGRRTPIIAVTAYIRPEEQTRCLNAGMDAVLMKPVRREELDEVLRALAPADPVISAVGGSVKLLARVSDAFAKQTPPLLLLIRDAIANRDSFSLAQNAHKLKGSVSNFNGAPAFSFARQIEECARANDFDRASALFPCLEEAIADLQRRMSAALE